MICPRRLAGIDIGTLTCRLLIADHLPGQPLKEIHSERHILRLGEGVDHTKRLAPAAIDRVLACLQKWRAIIEAHGVDVVTAVATSAVREALNRDEFLTRVHHEARIEVEVLDGREEARRTLLGIRSGLPGEVADILALDIGGGSTEFVVDRPPRSPLVHSIELGVVRLAERMLQHDPPTVEEIERARRWVAKETTTALSATTGHECAVLVGTGGTMTSLAAMAQRLPLYEPARIHNFTLTLVDIRELEQSLLARRRAEREGMLGLEKGREDVIAAGAIITRTVMECCERTSLLVSDCGLREGALIDLVQRRR